MNICPIQYVSVSETGMKQGYPYTEMVIAMMTGRLGTVVARGIDHRSVGPVSCHQQSSSPSDWTVCSSDERVNGSA